MPDLTTAKADIDNDRFDTVKVDLDAEVLKMAQRDGVTRVADLQLPVSVTRYERYADVIRSFYQGKDVGYAEGILLVGRPYRRRMITALSVGVFVGGTLGSMVTAYLIRTVG
jgi:hypothetical protein